MMNKSLLFLFAALLFSCQPKPGQSAPPESGSNSWIISGFEKQDGVNPVLTPSDDLSFDCPLSDKEVKWEKRNVLNPSAVVKDDKVYLLYRAQDSLGTSRIGLAISEDGLNFKKNDSPVFYPDQDAMKPYEWNYKKRDGVPLEEGCTNCYFDGTEDPRVIESEDGTYVMTYTAYDGNKARLSLATSKDLIHWEKHGLVINDGPYTDLWSKSGAIVAELRNNKMVAVKINGYYWMYFGDTSLYLAFSEDLIHWEPALNEENGQMITVMHPRPGYFDSRLVEPGPFGLLTREGVLLIYNGSNASSYQDAELPKFTYTSGQALFDKNAPYKLIDRTKDYFLWPEKEYEMVGEVNNVCFVEGMVFFKNKWFLYYGTGDSKIAVAVSDVQQDKTP